MKGMSGAKTHHHMACIALQIKFYQLRKLKYSTMIHIQLLYSTSWSNFLRSPEEGPIYFIA